MKSHSPLQLSPPALCFLACIFLLLQLHPASSNPALFYRTCGNTFSCGSITGIGYPFRGYKDPAYCGYPGLELRCDQSNSITKLEIKNMTYRVLEIYPTTQTLRVAREDVMEAACPTDLVNTTLDYSLFDYAGSYINLTFLYGCPSAGLPGLNSGPFSCGSNGGNTVYVLPGVVGPGNCKASVVYPAVQMGNGGSINFKGLDQVLRRGFDIRWKADTSICSECRGSEGRCGYNFGTNQTTCFCPNQPYVESVACSIANGDQSPSKEAEQQLPLPRPRVSFSALSVMYILSIIFSAVGLCGKHF